MADKSKNTGTGGINIDNKVVTMDVGVPDAQADNSKNWSAGDISVDKSVKDLSKPTRETFAKYLSKATLGAVGSSPHKNQYPVGNGESTTLQEISLKDQNGNPISPGQQNNENKFNAGFNQTIASNNPAGIKKGLTTGVGQDGNTLLPSASTAADSGGNYVKFVTTSGTKGLQEPIKTYTSTTVAPNLYDYDSTRVAIADGTLNQPPDAVREIKVVPSKASVATDGGTSNNILSDEPDYVLTDEDARAQAGLRTTQNFFPIEFATELVKPWDVNNKPISVTAAQNSITNINFFTKIVKIQGEGEDQSQVVSALQLPTYTDAYQEAVTEGFEIKRGQTAAGEKAVDGNRLLTGIAPLNEQKKATLTTGAQAYLTNVVGPNVYNDGSAKVEIPEYENDSAPSGVRVLNVTTTLAADGGTSKNIANQSRQLTLAQAATIVQNKTTGNAYPVDAPTVGSGPSISITPVKISAADKLAKTANTKYFADLSIGSNPAISKGKLKNKDSSNNDLPDGNTLLPNASTQATAGLSYIKFVASDSAGTVGLNAPIKGYTGGVVKLNLFNYDSSLVTLSDGALGVAPLGARENLKYIPSDASITVDGGTSTNILGVDGEAPPDYTLTLVDRATQASIVTADNFFKVDAPTVNQGIVSTTKVVLSTPLSVTDAQANPFASSFFTKEVQKVNNVDTVFSKLQSTYTGYLGLAAQDASAKFIIKRGKAQKQDGVDGNSLLSTIAPETANGGERIATLTPGANTYTQLHSNDNLNKIYNTKSELNKGVKIPRYEDLGVPSDITDLNTATFIDKGKSSSIFQGLRKLDLKTAAITVANKTAINSFPVDSPVIGIGAAAQITPVTISSTTILSPPKNTTFFTKRVGVDNSQPTNILGSSYSNAYIDASKPNNQNPLAQFSIKRGKVEGNGEDGDDLLPNATIPGTIFGPYVKFTKLNNNVRNYTTVQLKKNLYSYNNIIDLNDVKNIDFFGPRLGEFSALYKPLSGPSDSGTFDNIQSDPSSRELGLFEALTRSQQEVGGTYSVGQIGNALTPYYGLNPLPSIVSINDNDGYPISPTAAQLSSIFIEDPPLTEYIPGSLIPSSYSDYAADLKIKRGKKSSNDPDGNTLLKNAATPVAGEAQFIKIAKDVAPSIGDYVTSILNKNRYSPTKSGFVPGDTPGAESGNFNEIKDYVEDAQRNQSFVYRTKLYAPHELSPGESPQSTTNRGVALKGYNFRSLTRVGTLLQFNAAGEIAYLAGYNDNRGNLAELAALAPGLGQGVAGFPLSQEYLKVTEIIKNLPVSDDSNDSSIGNNAAQYEGELIDFNRHFEGIINTTSEKFSSYSSIAIFVLAIILVVVVVLALQGLANLLASSQTQTNYGNINVPYPDGGAAEEGGIRYFGSFRGRQLSGGTNLIDDLVNAISTGNFAGTLFGIKPTTNRNYSDAVFTGMLAFFGLGKSVPPVLAFPGQVVVTARAIVRSVSNIVKQLVGIGVGFASGNVLDAIFKLIGIIESVRNSKLIGAMNVFSQLGDRKPIRILASKYAIGTEEQPESLTNPELVDQSELFRGSQEKDTFEQTRSGDAGKVVSEIDAVFDSMDVKDAMKDKASALSYYGVSHIKNRRQGSDGLAWANYRAPSLYLSTNRDMQEVQGTKVNKLIGYHKEYVDVTNSQSSYAVADDSNRIPTDKRKQMEAILDAEYIPFYFHDLRTNEIIGFHAFLTSLSDDYTANYEAFSGLGRIEAIKTYKDTQRKIGLSFILAATDINDFDTMWEKINKLTTLVYPQYTDGKLYQNSDTGYTFQKPFTQQIAAGPMVRLRVGNLFTSNYSRFNLAGIFGLFEKNASLGIVGDEKRTNEQNRRDAQATQKAQAKAQQANEQAFAEWLKDPKNKFQKDYTFKVLDGLYFDQITAEYKKRLNKNAPAPKNPPTQQALSAAANKKNVSNLHYTVTTDKKNTKTIGPWYRVKKEGMPDTFSFKITEILNDADEKPILFKGQFVIDADDARAAVSGKDLPGGWEAKNKEFYVPIDKIGAASTTTFDKQVADARAKKITKDTDNITESGKQLADSQTILEFMGDGIENPNKGNAIVRSFESAGGEGLAGFIDSIAFDWYENVTWDVDIERQAPKMCKITISFTPVHDISPGLDRRGRNRAPIYRVGAAMRTKSRSKAYFEKQGNKTRP